MTPSLFERTAKINRHVLWAAGLVCAAALTQPAVAGSDLWWHLAAGRLIWATRAIPVEDSLSYTFLGSEWINHEWLWDALAWPLYRWAPTALAVANAALVVGIGALTYRVARRESDSPLAAIAALCGVAAASHWFIDVRPHLVTLLAVAAFLATRQARWAVWAWAPAIALWCNLHGGFVFGIGAVGLLALVETLRATRARRGLAIAWRPVLGAAGACLAWLANPWGWKLAGYPLAYLKSDSPYRSLIEWLPPQLNADLSDVHARFWLLLGLAIAGAPLLARRDVYPVLLAAVAAAMAVQSRRFIPLFAITAAPLVACALAGAAAALRARWRPLAHPAWVAAAAVLALGATAAGVRDVRLGPDWLGRWTQRDVYPDAALRYLRALDPGPRLLNLYNWGGYVALHAPELRVFIDGRANTIYDDAHYRAYLAWLAGRPGAVAGVLGDSPSAALLPVAQPQLERSLVERGWRRVYRDDWAVVLLPGGAPAERPAAHALLAEHPQWRVTLAGRARREGRLAEARLHAQRALTLDPVLVPAHRELLLVAGELRDAKAIERAARAARRSLPRRTADLARFEARAWELAGRPDRALDALARARRRGPFAPARDDLAAWRERLAAGARSGRASGS